MSSASNESSEHQHPPSIQSSVSSHVVQDRMILPRTQGLSPLTSSPKRRRTSHACDRCRLRRLKCTGGTRCENCAGNNELCNYSDRKRELNQKSLTERTQWIESFGAQNSRLMTFIQKLRSDSRLPIDVQSEIAELLSNDKKDWEQSPGFRPSSSLSSWAPPDEPGMKDVGETATSARVGSPGALGYLSSVIDLGSGAGAVGLVGNVSELSWIQRCWEILSGQPISGIDASTEGLELQLSKAQDINYHMDDADLLSVEEGSVDTLEWPSLETATALSEAYFSSLQGPFPFIDPQHFRTTIGQFSRRKFGYSWGERRWLSVANLVFGLGSKWLHLIEPEIDHGVDNHLTYYARARALGLDHRMLFDHPTLEQVQALGVLALYLFVNNSIARSWTILGHALRHATALGLHLRVTAESISTQQKASRVRTWYSLYTLEIILTEFTGRPCSVTISDISAPTDTMRRGAEPKDDTQAFFAGYNPNLLGVARSAVFPEEDILPQHFFCRIQLSVLSHRICVSLYSATVDVSWFGVQIMIRQFDLDLQRWISRLPAELSATRMMSKIKTAEPAIELAMYYWSVRMILFRPCLCDMMGRIENESQSSREFNRESATACVAAALSLLDLMPNDPERGIAYRVLPWWALLHYICQAVAVLLLETCLEAQHCPLQVDEIMMGLRKAMSYLRMMSSISLSAYKAWRVCRQLLADAASRLGCDTSDVPIDAPQPPGWNANYEMLLANALENMGGPHIPTSL